jgi:site-specific recombinase XerD
MMTRPKTPSAVCFEAECEAPARPSSGLCNNHYEYYRRHGLLKKIPDIKAAIEAGARETAIGRGATGPKLWEVYLKHLEATAKRPMTIRMYRRALYAFWGHCNKLSTPQLVTKQDLQSFLTRTIDSPRSRGQRLSPVSANNYGVIVKGAYRWFAENGFIGAKNPLVGYELPKVTLGPPRALEPDQVAQLFEAAEASARVAQGRGGGGGAIVDDRLVTMLWLAYGAGLRVSEIAAVRIEHIHPARGRQPMRIEVFGKGGYRAMQPVSPEAADWLKRYMAGRPRTGPLLEGRGPNPGQPLKGDTVSKAISQFMRSQGINETAHSLRHTYATELMIASEGNLRAVQRLVRHKSSTTTERYTSAYDGEMFAVSALLPNPRRVG